MNILLITSEQHYFIENIVELLELEGYRVSIENYSLNIPFTDYAIHWDLLIYDSKITEIEVLKKYQTQFPSSSVLMLDESKIPTYQNFPYISLPFSAEELLMSVRSVLF